MRFSICPTSLSSKDREYKHIHALKPEIENLENLVTKPRTQFCDICDER